MKQLARGWGNDAQRLWLIMCNLCNALRSLWRPSLAFAGCIRQLATTDVLLGRSKRKIVSVCTRYSVKYARLEIAGRCAEAQKRASRFVERVERWFPSHKACFIYFTIYLLPANLLIPTVLTFNTISCKSYFYIVINTILVLYILVLYKTYIHALILFLFFVKMYKMICCAVEEKGLDKELPIKAPTGKLKKK